MLNSFDIQSPFYLLLVLLVPLLWYVHKLYKQFRTKGLQVFGSMASDKNPQVGGKFGLFLVGFALVAISAINPRIQGKPINIEKKGGDVIFALDVSRSMLAEDVKPSRLERAKLVCLDLLKGFDNQRVAIVVFAEGAYVTMPFTTNYGSVATFIQEASPNLISAQGSDFSNLVATLVEYFGKDRLVERGVIVLSDGEDHSGLETNDVLDANKAGLVFYTVGVGTKQGVPIPDGRGYFQDKTGNKVITKLQTSSLRKLAGSKGKYFSISQTHALLRKIRHLRESNFSDITTYEYSSMYQFLLLPGLLMILLSFFGSHFNFAKAKRASILLIGFMSFANLSLAQNGHKEFLKGDKNFKKENYKEAAQHYESILQKEKNNAQALYNLGVAKAKSSNKKEALSYFAQAADAADNQEDRAAALYNSGTLLLTEKDKIEKSIELLKEALRNNPRDPAIRRNLAKALQIKKKQDKQKQQNNKDQKNQKNQQSQDSKDSQKEDQKKQKEQQQKQQKDKRQEDQSENNQSPGQEDKQFKSGQQNQKQDQQRGEKKQKALQRLKSVEESERKVRRKLLKSRGKSSKKSGKNW